MARKRPRLRAKYSGAGLEEVPLLYLGEEEDFYEGENRDMVLRFEITEAGKHYKITYRGDQRYMVTVGKTPSDNRSGSNNAAMIGKVML